MIKKCHFVIFLVTIFVSAVAGTNTTDFTVRNNEENLENEKIASNKAIRKALTKLWLVHKKYGFFNKQTPPNSLRFEFASSIDLTECPDDFVNAYKKHLDVIKNRGKQYPAEEERAFWEMAAYARDHYQAVYQEFLSYFFSSEQYKPLLDHNPEDSHQKLEKLFDELEKDLMKKIDETYPKYTEKKSSD